jgi:predicted transcriptional regulator
MGVTEDARRMLETRLAELQPYLDEAEEIAEMLRTLDRRRQPRKKRVPMTERRDVILRLVADRPGMRVGELAGELGVSVPRAVQLVNELEQRGDLRRTGDGLMLGKAKAGHARAD